MLSIVNSSVVVGIEAIKVRVETDITRGIPTFTIVGLAGTATKESRERVKSAIINSGYDFPLMRIVINLSPADIKKDGSIFDLAIAIGIIYHKLFEDVNKLKYDMDRTCFIGELSLDATVKYTRGALSVVCDMKKEGIDTVFIPRANYKECSTIEGIDIVPVSSLKECIDYLIGKKIQDKGGLYNNNIACDNRIYNIDMSEVKGNFMVKRAVEIAVSGGHNLLMIGPPGSGKSMIAERIPTIMDSMTNEEKIEVTKIYSISGLIDEESGLINRRPFRSPHHTITKVAMAGGGINYSPGEVTLSNKGILFLDELAEFSQSILDTLRQPMESGKINVSRIRGTQVYPAEFMLVGAMNPCKCGYYKTDKECICKPYEINRYINKISGPILDRMDIVVDVQPTDVEDLKVDISGESSRDIKNRLRITEEFRRKYRRKMLNSAKAKKDKIYLDLVESQDENEIIYRKNSRLSQGELSIFCALDSESEKALKNIYNRYNLSTRMYYKLIRLARTVADIKHNEDIKPEDIYEAFSMRAGYIKYFGDNNKLF